MVFTRKRKTRKFTRRGGRRFHKRKLGHKRRMGSRKRSFKRRRSHKRGQLSHVTAPTMRLNVIPKTADRLHVKLNYKSRGLLGWDAVAERHIGTVFLPTYLGVNSVNNGPYKLAWPNAGTNVTFVSNVSTTPGFLTLVSRYTQYYVTSVSITVRVVRQEATDSTSCVIGMFPLTAAQFTRLNNRNTALSPTANNSFWLPTTSTTSTTVATTAIYEEQLMTIKQQAYLKMRTIKMPYSGGNVATLHQRYSAKKFSQMGYPYSSDFSGTLPAVAMSDGTPPALGFQHYFFMHNTGPSAGAEKFDLDFDMTIHATFHRPTFMQVAPTMIQKSDLEETKEDVEDLIDQDSDAIMTPNLSNLSLTSPHPVTLERSTPPAPLRAPPGFKFVKI